MKLTAVILLAVCLQAHARGYSQRITLNLRNVPLEKVLKEIKKQSPYLFLYKFEDVKKVGKVSINVKDVSVSEALSQSLSSTNFTFSIVDRTIVLNPGDKTPLPGEGLFAAVIDVRGKVTDADGLPLAGASVRVQGKRTATSTNELGEFLLKGVEEQATLEISFIGYTTRMVPVAGQADLQIRLERSESTLDETVIIGYGTTSKRLNTGSVSSVTSEQISRQPVADPIAALQGQVPGLMISSSNGMPGSSFQVRIRGENSMKSGNDPLYIIDGVPFISSPLNLFDGANGMQSPLNSISPNDIDRIDVLKDADATAIYGSRGANGVVLITTKKGKSGKSDVSVNIYTGMSKASHKLDMLNTEQYLALRKEAFENDAATPTVSNAPDLLEWDQHAYTDWQDLLIGNTAPLTEAQVSFSGGDAQTHFLLSGGYRNEGSVLKGDFRYKKGSLLLTADHHSLNGKMSVNASLSYTTDNNNTIPTDVTQYFYLPPNQPVYNPDGSLYWWGNSQNPVAYLERTYQTKTDNLIANTVLQYTLLPGLNIKANLGFTQTSMRQVQTLPAIGFNPATYSGSSSEFAQSSVKSYIIEPQVDYSLTAGPGKLNLLAGASWQQSSSLGEYLEGSGYSSDALLKDLASATSLTVLNNYSLRYNYQSVFGRANYNIAEKYLLNLTFRRDGSSRFGPGKQFGNFGAVGAAWIFTNEPFVYNALPFLSFGKLRASYGTTGNDQIGDYQYLETWSSTSFPYDGVTGLYPTRVFNPDYSWEINKKLEAALELGFLKDRILASISYYNNRSSNQLVGYSLSPQTGFTEYIANFPAKVQNSGWEFDINTINIQNRNLTWRTSFNITIPKNELLEYPGLENSADAESYEVGESIRLIKGFHFLGVDPATGLPTYLDVNKDGSISEADDYVVIGETMPALYGGFSNQLSYKKFTLDIFFQFVKQEAPTVDYGPLVNPYGSMENKSTSALDRWTTNGDITGIPRATTTSSNAAYADFRNNYRYSDAAWGDASYIRLKNLSLAYDLSSVTEKWKIKNSSVYIQGQNLLTITNYKGLDPEINGFDRRFVYPVNPFGSVKTAALPVLRTITLGLRLTL